MSHFWSSTQPESYIEPKREFQGVGVIDFVQPFLIQTMTKPGFSTINSVKAKKILKNGTIRTENHYATDYALNNISLSIIDSHASQLNQAETLFDILTNGGYTLRSNQIGSFREALRFPAMQILELSPIPKSRPAAAASTAVSAVTGFLDALGSANPIGEGLNAAVNATNFLGLNVSGVWTIIEPVITSVTFGNISYDSEGIVKISLNL